MAFCVASRLSASPPVLVPALETVPGSSGSVEYARQLFLVACSWILCLSASSFSDLNVFTPHVDERASPVTRSQGRSILAFVDCIVVLLLVSLHLLDTDSIRRRQGGWSRGDAVAFDRQGGGQKIEFDTCGNTSSPSVLGVVNNQHFHGSSRTGGCPQQSSGLLEMNFF